MNDTQGRICVKYIYSAQVSGANGYIEKTQYSKFLKNENLQKLKMRYNQTK